MEYIVSRTVGCKHLGRRCDSIYESGAKGLLLNSVANICRLSKHSGVHVQQRFNLLWKWRAELPIWRQIPDL